MTDLTPFSAADPETRRALLKHLAREGMGENSLRALASDLAYLEAWSVGGDENPGALAGAPRALP
jgi:hypothetical protein